MARRKDHPKVQSFINTVMSRFEFAEAYHETKATVECYLHSILDEYCVAGLAEEDAVEQAIKQVGDPVKIGDELNYLESLHACLL